jgi:hypothetical protein
MQPAPKGRNSGSGSSRNGRPRLVVDPRPGDARDIGINPPGKRRIVVDPPSKRKVPNPGLGKKPGRGRVVPNPGMGVDDRIYRTMPITEKQLGSIKKMYGFKG